MSPAVEAISALQPPILPDEPSNRVSQRAFWIKLFVSALLIGIALQVADPAWLKNILLVRHGNSFLTAFTFLIALAASVALHELGHLVPSLCFGFNVSRLVLGPLCVSTVSGKWKVRYSPKWFSASVSALPPDERAWRLRMLLVIAGGPIASLCAFLYAIHGLSDSGPSAPQAEFLAGLAQLNLFIFVLGLVPNSPHSPVRNDARLFLTFLQNGGQAEQIKLYHAVTRLQVAGARPSDYPKELIARLACAKGNYDLMLFNALSIFLWALDSGKIAVADAWDRHALALLQIKPLRLSNTVLIESATFDILHRNLPDSAARKLRTIEIQSISPWLALRAGAALQLAGSAYSDAFATLSAARTSLPAGLPYSQFEQKLLDSLEHRAMLLNSRIISMAAAA